MSNIDWEKILKEDGDPFEIESSIVKTSNKTPQIRLREKFEEINAFIDKNNRLPEQSSDALETQLYFRLQNIIEDVTKQALLKEFDRHNVLNIDANDIQNVKNILDDDEFNILFGKDDDIFELKYVKSKEERQKTDFIARRKPCKDFEKYKSLFKQCHNDLKNNIRKLTKFDENQIQEGRFFVVHGVMVYIDKLLEIKRVQRGYENKFDGRTHLIFENGTESSMRYRSLCKRLYENGFYVSSSLKEIEEDVKKMADKQISTGKIYILKSLSKDEQIKDIKNLYKIGFSTTTVEYRIKNAKNETTYLMAPVKIMAAFDTFDMNTQKFENLLHRFFDICRVNIDVYDNNGTRHTVREWFQMPYEEIIKAINLLISGQIIKYKYDKNLKQIVQLED